MKEDTINTFQESTDTTISMTKHASTRVKKRLRRVIIFTLIFACVAMTSIFVFHEVFDFTSSNSALYFLRGKYGGIEIKRDILIEEADRMVFMVDMNNIFNYFMKGLAVARREPVLELTWDKNIGMGEIKQYRHDGTILSLSLSRFDAEGDRPRGLFIGGELPYGDPSRSSDQDSSGFGYFDGEDWHHVWCAIDEGFKILGEEQVSVLPLLWDFENSRVLKNSGQEVILESNHKLDYKGHKVRMNRLASFRAGDDYIIFRIKFTNEGNKPLAYGYSWGDEPWVGHFGGAKGDVGWSRDGLIQYEKFISPARERFVGLWDYGNEAAGEDHNFSGIANFVEWYPPIPSLVFLSNKITDCCNESVPLSSYADRVISLVWLNQMLLPGQSRTYTLSLGMAPIDEATGFPKKPDTVL